MRRHYGDRTGASGSSRLVISTNERGNGGRMVSSSSLRFCPAALSVLPRRLQVRFAAYPLLTFSDANPKLASRCRACERASKQVLIEHRDATRRVCAAPIIEKRQDDRRSLVREKSSGIIRATPRVQARVNETSLNALIHEFMRSLVAPRTAFSSESGAKQAR